MTNTHMTFPRHQPLPDHEVALSLKDRVAGGRGIWLLGRFVIGALFLMSGVEKLMGLNAFAGSLIKGGLSSSVAHVLAPIAALAETLGGFCIMVGLATTWASLVMFAFTIIAALIAHRFWEIPGGEERIVQMNHFIKNMMIAASFCLLYVAGGGPCSIDRWRREAKLSGS
jgi:putative oxidoreductase